MIILQLYLFLFWLSFSLYTLTFPYHFPNVLHPHQNAKNILVFVVKPFPVFYTGAGHVHCTGWSVTEHRLTNLIDRAALKHFTNRVGLLSRVPIFTTVQATVPHHFWKCQFSLTTLWHKPGIFKWKHLKELFQRYCFQRWDTEGKSWTEIKLCIFKFTVVSMDVAFVWKICDKCKIIEEIMCNAFMWICFSFSFYKRRFYF